jgi:hypothetical protein
MLYGQKFESLNTINFNLDVIFIYFYYMVNVFNDYKIRIFFIIKF